MLKHELNLARVPPDPVAAMPLIERGAEKSGEEKD